MLRHICTNLIFNMAFFKLSLSLSLSLTHMYITLYTAFSILVAVVVSGMERMVCEILMKETLGNHIHMHLLLRYT